MLLIRLSSSPHQFFLHEVGDTSEKGK